MRLLTATVLGGAILAAGRILDAFSDPLIGYWSDRSGEYELTVREVVETDEDGDGAVDRYSVVYEEEPLVHPGLLNRDDVVLLPIPPLP